MGVMAPSDSSHVIRALLQHALAVLDEQPGTALHLGDRHQAADGTVTAHDFELAEARSEARGWEKKYFEMGEKRTAAAAQTEQLRNDLDEARSWARHGYEIGQRHCGWTDHGVAPDWLTEGWLRSFDSCEHLNRASELDTKLTAARAVFCQWCTKFRHDPPRPELFGELLHEMGAALGVTVEDVRRYEAQQNADRLEDREQR